MKKVADKMKQKWVIMSVLMLIVSISGVFTVKATMQAKTLLTQEDVIRKINETKPYPDLKLREIRFESDQAISIHRYEANQWQELIRVDDQVAEGDYARYTIISENQAYEYRVTVDGYSGEIESAEKILK